MEFYSRRLTELDNFWLEDHWMAISDLENKVAKIDFDARAAFSAAAENAKAVPLPRQTLIT